MAYLLGGSGIGWWGSQRGRCPMYSPPRLLFLPNGSMGGGEEGEGEGDNNDALDVT
jgi:hypothetical protein